MERRKPKANSGRRKTDISVKALNLLKKELFTNQDKAIAAAIEKYVNGGIKGVRKELDDYILLDKNWKVGDALWKEVQEAKTAPSIKAYRQGSDFFIVLKALIGFLVLIGGGIIAWLTIKSKILL